MKALAHFCADADALSGIEKLRRFGKNKIPGINDAEIGFWGGELDPFPKENVVFVDTSPNGLKADPQKGIFVFNHHPHSMYPGQTACSMIDKEFGLTDEKNAELTEWAATNDFFLTGDPLVITRVIIEMHSDYSDDEVYKWFASHIDAHFNAPELSAENLGEGLKLFEEMIEKFIDDKECLPGTEAILSDWLRRAEITICNKMALPHRIAVHLAYFGKEETENWFLVVLRSVEEGQRIFLQAEEDFKKAEKIIAGDKVIVIAESGNLKFHNFARGKRAREMLGIKTEPIVLVFKPNNSGFQIFPNKSGFRLEQTAIDLRMEILGQRGNLIPLGWQTVKEGTLEGTEPLYFHNTGMQMLMWGWRTAPNVRPMDITQETVKRIVCDNARS